MADTSQTTMDVTELLKNDHDKVRSLFKDLMSDKSGSQKNILKKIQEEFTLHSDVEEKIVYPAYKDAIDDREAAVTVSENLDEHRIAKETLKKLIYMEVDSVQFEGRIKVLHEQIEHHASEEEENMFPKMREACSHEQLASLSKKVLEAKEKAKKSN